MTEELGLRTFEIMMNSFNSHTRILWQQVWGLAALLAAIIFSWMVYGMYQPQILQKLEFVQLAAWLGIGQGLMAAVIEPFIGNISDKIQRRLGSRLPMISFGVTLAGLIFIASALLMQQKLTGAIRLIVPVMMTVWVMAMIIFQGPAIALLIQFAPQAELPQAGAVLVFVFGLVGATRPLLNIVLKNIGASVTFILGAIALVVGAYILRSYTPTYKLPPLTENKNRPAIIPKLLLIIIFIIGFGAALEVNLMHSIFPQFLHAQLRSIKTEFIASSILLISAFTSFPLGTLTTKIGVNQAMLLGLGIIVGLMGIGLLHQNDFLALGLILGFGISFGLVFVSMIPFALGMLPSAMAGLSTGLYFGGGAAATAFVSILMKPPGIEPIAGFLLASLGFVTAAFCLVISQRIRPL
jgi:MFS family permease